jgi:hypothetical protein
MQGLIALSLIGLAVWRIASRPSYASSRDVALLILFVNDCVEDEELSAHRIEARLEGLLKSRHFRRYLLMRMEAEGLILADRPFGPTDIITDHRRFSLTMRGRDTLKHYVQKRKATA